MMRKEGESLTIVTSLIMHHLDQATHPPTLGHLLFSSADVNSSLDRVRIPMMRKEGESLNKS